MKIIVADLRLTKCTTVAEQLVDPIVQMANIIDYKVIPLIFQAVAK